MLYIITEDSNSARYFWECVAKTFRKSTEYIMVPLPKDAQGNNVGGNSTLNAQVSNIFKELKSGISLKRTPIVLDALTYVHKQINAGYNYYDQSKEITEFINTYRGAGKNREHFANTLLVAVTQQFKGYFKIVKAGNAFENQAMCWLQNCTNIQNKMVPQQIDNICNNQCLYCCKKKSTKEKLIDLENKSLYIINLPFCFAGDK